MAIGIGNDAIDREWSINMSTFNVLYVDYCSPATKNGTVTKLRIFLKGGGLGGSLRMGSLYKTGATTFSSRDWGVLAVPGLGLVEYTQWRHLDIGGEQPILMEVHAGDLIGVRMWKSAEGNGMAAGLGAGYWRSLAESDFPYVNYDLNLNPNIIISLNGEMARAFVFHPFFKEVLGY